MKTTIITEIVKFELLQSTTNEQFLAKSEKINSFLQEQDGFIDAELITSTEGNTGYFIYHIENMEKLRAVGEKLRAARLFDEILPLLVPGSMNVSFYNLLKTW